MRVYELGFILKPDLPEQEAQESLESVKRVLASGGANVDKVDDWGKRPLAYRVHGFWSGHYIFIQYSTNGDRSLNRELERRLRVSDHVIKYMVIRIDEDLKRLAKAQARRAKRQPLLDAKAAARAAEGEKAKAKAPGKPEPELPATPATPVPAEPQAAEGPAEPEVAKEAAAETPAAVSAEAPAEEEKAAPAEE